MPRHPLRLGAALLFALFILFIVFRANQSDIPEIFRFYKRLPLGDKLGHGGLMGTLSFLVNWAWQGKVWKLRLGDRAVPLLRGSVVVLTVVSLEEISQAWIPARTLSWSDWIADVIGITVGGWLAQRFLHRKPPGEKV